MLSKSGTFGLSQPEPTSEAWDILSKTCSNEAFWRFCSAGQDGKKAEWSYMFGPSNSGEVRGRRNWTADGRTDCSAGARFRNMPELELALGQGRTHGRPCITGGSCDKAEMYLICLR
jgi:hypothetical protein